MYEFEFKYFDYDCLETEEDEFYKGLSGMIQNDGGLYYV